MTTFWIQIIAYASMFIDHITAIFVPRSSEWYLIGRGIGRIAFPLFCFLLVQGYRKTHDLRKYAIRLACLAVVSEFFYDFAFMGNDGMRTTDFFLACKLNYVSHFFANQNVVLTLLLGLGLIWVYDMLMTHYRNRQLLFTIYGVISILTAAGIAHYMKADYGATALILIMAMFVLDGNKVLQVIATGIVLCLFWGVGISWCALACLPIIFLYNGKQGIRLPNHINYLFYPVHLGILGVIAMLCR